MILYRIRNLFGTNKTIIYLYGVQVIGGSNPLAPTNSIEGLQVRLQPFFISWKLRKPVDYQSTGWTRASRSGATIHSKTNKHG